MTNQVFGEILYGGMEAETWLYTPWMPVRGDVGLFGVEILQVNSETLSWTVETRKREDAMATEMFTVQSDTTTGVHVFESTTDAEELFRYKFKTSTTASTTNFVVLRPLQPSWQVDR